MIQKLIKPYCLIMDLQKQRLYLRTEREPVRLQERPFLDYRYLTLSCRMSFIYLFLV